mgnify:CR=1 FL=1|tara:strand:+ start:269 stop:679 length:411 start_codon:yes stop_codon:yes gene_type:complete
METIDQEDIVDDPNTPPPYISPASPIEKNPGHIAPLPESAIERIVARLAEKNIFPRKICGTCRRKTCKGPNLPRILGGCASDPHRKQLRQQTKATARNHPYNRRQNRSAKFEADNNAGFAADKALAEEMGQTLELE